MQGFLVYAFAEYISSLVDSGTVQPYGNNSFVVRKIWIWFLILIYIKLSSE